MSLPGPGGRDDRQCDLLLTGGCVVTVDERHRILDPGAVAIRGDRIVAVGAAPDLRRLRARRVVDCAGCALLPGLVDTHTHLFQALVRGLGEGLPIHPWLREVMWPYASVIGAEDARVAATLGAIEAVRGGVTCVVDNHYAPTDADTTVAIAEAIAAVGLRGAVARGMVGRRTEIAARRALPDQLFRYSSEEELEITRECMRRRPAGSVVEIWPAPLNLVHCDQELVRQAVALARELGTRWHTHCSEGRTDPVHYLEAHGVRPVAWLAREGLLDPSATLAHCIWLDDTEVEQVGAAGPGVAHNPVSNAYLASGTMRLRALRAGLAAVGLGTDGPSAGHRQDMFESMKQAILLQRVHTLDPTVVRAEEVLELATREGARYAGIAAGALAAGRFADVVVVDLDQPHLQPVNRPVATLVYAARGSDVRMTIVGGRIAVEDGRCALVDEAEVLAEARERADRLLHVLGLGGGRVPSDFPGRPAEPAQVGALRCAPPDRAD